MRPVVGLVVGALAVTAGCARDATIGAPLRTEPPMSSTPVATTTTRTIAPATATISTATISTTPGTTTSTTISTTTSTTTPSTTGAPTTTGPPWPRSASMAFSGDILPHSPLWRQAEENAAERGLDGHDFGPMLSGLRSVHDRVDLAVCHLETPIAPAGEEYTTSPFYGVPTAIAAAIRTAGFDRCSTASNHTADRGTAGIDRTVAVLESEGVAQSGMARRPDEIEPLVFDVGGITISHLSYTWSYNGLSLPEGEEWRSALIDPERIVADARTARTSGAQVVVVSLHWGAEGVTAPTGFQRRIADEITADGQIDLIVGHHAHVLQPIERVNDRWVVFGLGNILSNLPTSSRWPDASQDAAIVTVDLTVDRDGGVAVGRPIVHPTWVDRDAGWTVRLVATELAREDLDPGQRSRLEASLERTRRVLGDFVAPTPGAPVAPDP